MIFYQNKNNNKMLTSKLKDEELQQHTHTLSNQNNTPVLVTFNFISPKKDSTDSVFANSSQMNAIRLPQFLQESEQYSKNYVQTSKHFYQETRQKNEVQQILDSYENFQEKLLSKYKKQEEPKRKIFLFSREKDKNRTNRSNTKQNKKFLRICTIKSIRLKNTHKIKEDDKILPLKINIMRTPMRSPAQSKRGISLSTLTLKKSEKSVDSHYLCETAQKKEKRVIYLTPRKKLREYSERKHVVKKERPVERKKPKLKILKTMKFREPI